MTDFIARTLELAERGRFSVSPNPMVGCVIEKDGRILGEGFHEKAGEPHAEIVALRACEESPRGATVWTNLEPCSHQGRTPPCTDALIEAGVAKVCVAIEDPSSQVAGRGIAKLRERGIAVEVGRHEEAAKRFNEKFLFSAANGRPFLLLKAGMTLDGKLATSTRKSHWITSEDSRQRSLALREEYDAMIVGSGTVIADDPQLTRRLGMNRSVQPWKRVIVDASGQIPHTSRLLTDGEPTLLFTLHPNAYHCDDPCEVIAAPRSGNDVDLRFVLARLDKLGVRSVIAEGGSLLHSEIIAKSLWQKMILFVAPMIVGGATSPSIFAYEGIENLTDAHRFRFDGFEPVGSDLMITAYPT